MLVEGSGSLETHGEGSMSSGSGSSLAEFVKGCSVTVDGANSLSLNTSGLNGNIPDDRKPLTAFSAHADFKYAGANISAI